MQAELIKFFQSIENGGRFIDPYFQEEINLAHITFFAAVNYKEKLATKLKDVVDLKELEGYTNEEKKQILQIKRTEMQKLYNLPKEKIEEVLSDNILEFLI